MNSELNKQLVELQKEFNLSEYTERNKEIIDRLSIISKTEPKLAGSAISIVLQFVHWNQFNNESNKEFYKQAMKFSDEAFLSHLKEYMSSEEKKNEIENLFFDERKKVAFYLNTFLTYMPYFPID